MKNPLSPERRHSCRREPLPYPNAHLSPHAPADKNVGAPLLFALGLLLAAATGLHAGPPVVSNVRAVQRPGTHFVDIYYHLAADGPCTVHVYVSDNAGANWNVPVFTTTGARGPGVQPGLDRLITWNAGVDWPGRFNNQCKVRILADDGSAPPAPPGMAYIPAGAFQMGDPFYEGGADELPVHTVFLSAFFMDKFEVSRELWLDVYSWAVANGYNFANSGGFKGPSHPVHSINWYDAVKWCNARSERDGLTPCYYTDATQTTVYRTGQFDLTNACVKWSANGFRLPTEAEWEKAARGGLNGNRFPWGNTITHSQANYYSSTSYAYDISPTRGYHPTWETSSLPYTSPVGSFAPNGYGLFDMAGNLWEWCWDWFDGNWYGNPQATVQNPSGPNSALGNRVFRGGVWHVSAYHLRCASRVFDSPAIINPHVGFRSVRGL